METTRRLLDTITTTPGYDKAEAFIALVERELGKPLDKAMVAALLAGWTAVPFQFEQFVRHALSVPSDPADVPF